MNEVIRQLYARKSVRIFTDQPIEESIVQTILKAATMAPTAGNQQLYTIIRVNDPTLLDRLADSCDHQPFIARAKMVLVFCADPLKWHDAYLGAGLPARPLGAGDLLLAAQDAAIAAQNAVTAAWSLGIGSCYIGDILENRERQKEILNLPDGVVPFSMAVFGYPTAQQRERKKPQRAELRYIVHENAYRRMEMPELTEMLRYHFGEDPDGARLRAFCERKFNSGFSREMTRSVREYLKEFEGQ